MEVSKRIERGYCRERWALHFQFALVCLVCLIGNSPFIIWFASVCSIQQFSYDRMMTFSESKHLCFPSSLRLSSLPLSTLEASSLLLPLPALSPCCPHSASVLSLPTLSTCWLLSLGEKRIQTWNETSPFLTIRHTDRQNAQELNKGNEKKLVRKELQIDGEIIEI